MIDFNSIDYEQVCVEECLVTGMKEVIYHQIDRKGGLIAWWIYPLNFIYDHLKGIDSKIEQAIANKGEWVRV